jgi:hypothetical protein
MNNKNYSNDNQQIEYGGGKNPLSKHDHELYNEDDDIALPIIRIKRITGATREKWKIIDNSKETLVIEGSKITKKEKEFLRSPEGFSFLIAQYKGGVKTVSKMRTELKKTLK